MAKALDELINSIKSSPSVEVVREPQNGPYESSAIFQSITLAVAPDGGLYELRALNRFMFDLLPEMKFLGHGNDQAHIDGPDGYLRVNYRRFYWDEFGLLRFGSLSIGEKIGTKTITEHIEVAASPDNHRTQWMKERYVRDGREFVGETREEKIDLYRELDISVFPNTEIGLRVLEYENKDKKKLREDDLRRGLGISKWDLRKYGTGVPLPRQLLRTVTGI